MRLSGQHALITGGATGIGAAIAWQLAGEGARVSIIGRRLEPLKAAAAALEAQGFADIFFATADVTVAEDLAGAIAAARARNGRISILVNNAGEAESAPFLKVSEEMWGHAIAVNLDGVYRCCRAVLPDMSEAGQGRILTIASTAGLRGFAYSAPYVAAKHGAVGLMRALAVELAGGPVTANAICPGFTDTGIVARAVEKIRLKTGRGEAETRAELGRLNPGGRLIDPREVAELALDLILSDRNGEAVEIA